VTPDDEGAVRAASVERQGEHAIHRARSARTEGRRRAGRGERRDARFDAVHATV
jgi:hypothetical protein